jgi:hypothetical protein
MIGDSQRLRLWSGKFGMIAGMEAVPAIRNLALMAGCGYFGRFRQG